MTNEYDQNYDTSFTPGDNADIDLAQFDDAFAAAEVEERDFEEVPDGKYQVNVEKVELTRARSSGVPMLKWGLRILGPQHRGRMLWRNNVIGTPDNIKWLKNDLYTCGLQLTRLSELQANLGRLLDIKIEVNKRTNGDNTNIYFNKRIVTDGDVDQGNGNRRFTTDDIPF
jgi:hypothetical protein